MMKHSFTGRLLAVLLAAATLLTLVPAAMISVSAQGELPARIGELDPASLTVADAGKPNTVKVSVNTALLDTETYDYYYLALTGDEAFATYNCDDCAAMIARGSGYYRIETANYDKLDMTAPSVEVVIPSAEENYVFAILCAVAKDAEGYVPVYCFAWGSCSLTWVDTFSYSYWIQKGDASAISILPGTEVNTALVTVDTAELDYTHYDYYYLALTDTEDGAAYNSNDCEGMIGKTISHYCIDTGAYAALTPDFAGETVAIEEGYDCVFVILTAVSKGANGTKINVYTMAWASAKMEYVPAETMTEEEKAYAFAVSSGYMTAGENTAANLTYGEFLYRLWKACGSPAVTGTLTKFSGVSADGLYYNALLWAQENKYYMPSSCAINAAGTISRSTIIYIFNVMAGKPSAAGTVHFTDTAAGAAYIKQLDWAVNAGIVTEDVDAGAKFRPNSKAKLEDTILWVWRMNDKNLLG